MNSLSNDARDGPSASMNGSVAPIYASRWRFNLSGRGRVTEPGLSNSEPPVTLFHVAFWPGKVRLRPPTGLEDVEMKPKTAEPFASGTATGAPAINSQVSARVRANVRAQW